MMGASVAGRHAVEATPVNLEEFETFARQRLPRMVYDYYAGGALDEITLRENRAAYDRLALRPRVLRDVSERDLSVRLLGARLPWPVLVAPTAFHRLAHEDGELATASGARAAGCPLVLSSLSTVPMEEVMAAHDQVWFQLYVYKDRGLTRELVQRAEAAGAQAIVLTVDGQVWGRRERDVRNQFHLPPGIRVANALAGEHAEMPERSGESGLAAYVHSLFDPGLTWDDIDWLRGTTRLPVVVKGILHSEDARLAVEHGAAGIIVSNHGGRQLDTAIAAIRALPEVVAAVAGRAPVLVDGGIRRGTDVIKALVSGAAAVLIGRPVLWGLAVGGSDGVRQVLEALRNELDIAMALCGARRVEELGPGLLA
jgi:4-hydroxymandelate oxidase